MPSLLFFLLFPQFPLPLPSFPLGCLLPPPSGQRLGFRSSFFYIYICVCFCLPFPSTCLNFLSLALSCSPQCSLFALRFLFDFSCLLFSSSDFCVFLLVSLFILYFLLFLSLFSLSYLSNFLFSPSPLLFFFHHSLLFLFLFPVSPISSLSSYSSSLRILLLLILNPFFSFLPFITTAPQYSLSFRTSSLLFPSLLTPPYPSPSSFLPSTCILLQICSWSYFSSLLFFFCLTTNGASYLSLLILLLLPRPLQDLMSV